jgi:hypothetical protein
MKLSKRVRITEGFKGKSADPFWQLIKFDDILEVSANIGWTGKYAMEAYIKNLTTGEKTSTTGGRFAQLFDKLGYVDV